MRYVIAGYTALLALVMYEGYFEYQLFNHATREILRALGG